MTDAVGDAFARLVCFARGTGITTSNYALCCNTHGVGHSDSSTIGVGGAVTSHAVFASAVRRVSRNVSRNHAYLRAHATIVVSKTTGYANSNVAYRLRSSRSVAISVLFTLVGHARAHAASRVKHAMEVTNASGNTRNTTAILTLAVHTYRVDIAGAFSVTIALYTVERRALSHACFVGVTSVSGTSGDGGRNAPINANSRGITHRCRHSGGIAVAVLIACGRVGIHTMAKAAEKRSYASPAGVATNIASFSATGDAMSALAHRVDGTL